MSTEIIRAAIPTPMQLGECPVWHPDEQSLYWIDISAMQIHRLHVESATHRVWSLPSEPGCIARNASSGLIVAMRSGIAHFDTDTGALSQLVDAPYDTARLRFNDGRCDAAGRLWVGTLYEPRDRADAPLYRFAHGALVDSGNRATVSNGVAFSTDNKTLYHSDTTAHRISAFDFDIATGRLSNGRVFQQFSMDKSSDSYGGRPDGAAVDSENAYWCAMFEGGRILRYSAEGKLLREVRLPVRCPTMIAFGGPDLRTLYITTARQNRSADELIKYPLSGCVLSMRVDVAGRNDFPYLT
jgi:sugar lactone lactonase YvrE